MGKVTALHLNTVTGKSGHQMTGMAVSVCLTPAAPSPLPIPYPTMGTVAEGIIDPCMRTKIEGAKILTVGGCMKACHGNEPGTLKEVVSLNTGGPCFPWLGAPNVLLELGMAGITGSMGQMNKSITVGAGASASNASGGGGGDGAGGPGGGGPQGGGNGGAGGGGSNDGAGPPSPPAPPGADGQGKAGHPVDVSAAPPARGRVRDRCAGRPGQGRGLRRRCRRVPLCGGTPTVGQVSTPSSQHAGSWSDPTAPTGRGSHGGGFPGAPPHQD
ncbi:DUF4150 domain-containing protein [Sorangium sp. So ce590]|uniref:DUF4150 domain-containing protein n=1 Tax=Sorangium sp. So ce590 TaxID=3133317 RepID=UPI003F5DB376